MSENSKLESGIFQVAIWIIIFILIVIRIISCRIDADGWIWIVNYIGMSIALINLFINKCLQLKKSSHKKYKPFKGLTIIIVCALCVLSIPLYYAQLTDIHDAINDIITLLALFFSLSQNIWNFILNCIINILKK